MDIKKIFERILPSQRKEQPEKTHKNEVPQVLDRFSITEGKLEEMIKNAIKKEEWEKWENDIVEKLIEFINIITDEFKDNVIKGVKNNPFIDIDKENIKTILKKHVYILNKFPKNLKGHYGFSPSIEGERKAIFIKRQDTKKRFFSVLLHEFIHCISKNRKILLATNDTDNDLESIQDKLSEIFLKKNRNQYETAREEEGEKLRNLENESLIENIKQTNKLLSDILQKLPSYILEELKDAKLLYVNGFYAYFDNNVRLFLYLDELITEAIKRNLFDFAAEHVFGNSKEIKQEFLYNDFLDSEKGKNDMAVFNKLIEDIAENYLSKIKSFSEIDIIEGAKYHVIKDYLDNNFSDFYSALEKTYGKEKAERLAVSQDIDEIRNIILNHKTSEQK